MHLRNRRCGDGRAELGKMVFDFAPERVGHGPARLPHREGRQLVLQVPEILGELGPDQIGPGRQELAELYVTGTEAR